MNDSMYELRDVHNAPGSSAPADPLSYQKLIECIKRTQKPISISSIGQRWYNSSIKITTMNWNESNMFKSMGS